MCFRLSLIRCNIINVYIDTCVCMYVCVYACMYVCVYVYIHTYEYTYIHIYDCELDEVPPLRTRGLGTCACVTATVYKTVTLHTDARLNLPQYRTRTQRLVRRLRSSYSS